MYHMKSAQKHLEKSLNTLHKEMSRQTLLSQIHYLTSHATIKTIFMDQVMYEWSLLIAHKKRLKQR